MHPVVVAIITGEGRLFLPFVGTISREKQLSPFPLPLKFLPTFQKKEKMANISLVEGPYNQFQFKRVERPDWPRIVTHVQEYFMQDEPTCMLLGFPHPTDFSEEMGNIVQQVLGENLSFIVEHKETGEVCTFFCLLLYFNCFLVVGRSAVD